MKRFTEADVPDQTGKTVFITGANTGLGFEAASVLAGQNARVIIGCRSKDKAQQARETILKRHPEADVAIIALDLSDLASVKKAADAVAKETRLDVLINNAGVFHTPEVITRDGLDVRFAVNTIAPYLLTQRLIPLLGSNGRVINLSSAAQSPVNPEARSLGNIPEHENGSDLLVG